MLLVIESRNKNKKNKTADRIFTADTKTENSEVNKRGDNKDDKIRINRERDKGM